MNRDIWEGLGFGYKSTNGKICMIRCFACGMENYAMSVSSGRCAHCGHDANHKGENKNPSVSTGVSKNRSNQDPVD